ncbi:MAG TPA: DUF222 domain-containing protein [Acidimicrobiia bacterium]|nr:DUF222 domain-containing protein [Acidimicrobiia bacterium]
MRSEILEDIETMLPGPQLAAILAGVDREALSGFDRVRLLQADARMVAHYQARVSADINSVSGAVSELANLDDPDQQDVFYITASEVRAALSLTRRAAEVQTDHPFQLTERLPEVWRALHDGLIDLSRTRVICDQTSDLPRELARNVADVALERSPDQTSGQLRARLQRLIISTDPASARERYERRVEERRVVSELGEDGTANLLGLHLPPADTYAAMRRINRLARAARGRGDPRGIDQIRADILLDLLTGYGQTGGQHDRGEVDIRVDMTTLTGSDENPAEIPGWGPVIADIAHQVVHDQRDGQWRYIVTDENGRIVSNGITRRRPTTHQQRRVEARNPTCVFPGCRMPASQCDIDHHQAWKNGGLTTDDNLGPLCRHDHRNKHSGWKLQQTRPGSYQ